jgi:hypothetical protein
VPWYPSSILVFRVFHYHDVGRIILAVVARNDERPDAQ